MSIHLSVAVAAEQLQNARAEYDKVHDESEAARSRETTALNALNAAQRAFDEAVAATKKNAPWNSDWHNQHARSGSKP